MLWCRRLIQTLQERTRWKLRSLQAVQSKFWTHLCTSAMLITISASSFSSPIVISIFCHHFTSSLSFCIYSLSQLRMEKLHHVLDLIWSAKYWSIWHSTCIRKINTDKVLKSNLLIWFKTQNVTKRLFSASLACNLRKILVSSAGGIFLPDCNQKQNEDC